MHWGGATRSLSNRASFSCFNFASGLSVCAFQPRSRSFAKTFSSVFTLTFFHIPFLQFVWAGLESLHFSAPRWAEHSEGLSCCSLHRCVPETVTPRQHKEVLFGGFWSFGLFASALWDLFAVSEQQQHCTIALRAHKSMGGGRLQLEEIKSNSWRTGRRGEARQGGLSEGETAEREAILYFIWFLRGMLLSWFGDFLALGRIVCFRYCWSMNGQQPTTTITLHSFTPTRAAKTDTLLMFGCRRPLAGLVVPLIRVKWLSGLHPSESNSTLLRSGASVYSRNTRVE